MGAVADKMPRLTHLFLHLFLVSLGVAQSQDFPGDNEELPYLPPLLEEVDNSCPLTHECIPKEQCYHYQEDLDQLRNITMGLVEYEEMFSELSKLVCNKGEGLLLLHDRYTRGNNWGKPPFLLQ